MTDADVREALRAVIDPEIGINIVDLGLVYGVHVDANAVRITMTMTSPACPLRDYLQDLLHSTISSRWPDVRSVEVEIVSDPPWTDEMMSEAARRQLE
jgi:metal-sulfur cluster biosynthetic enzyme